MSCEIIWCSFIFFQAEDGIRDIGVTGVQTCALPIWTGPREGGEVLAEDRGERVLPVLRDVVDALPGRQVAAEGTPRGHAGVADEGPHHPVDAGVELRVVVGEPAPHPPAGAGHVPLAGDARDGRDAEAVER